MPRIRIRIKNHDGTPQRKKLWSVLEKINIYMFKVIDTKDAFILVTDNSQMEKVLDPVSRRAFDESGFEVLTPLEYNAARTLLVRGIDSYISDKAETEIEESIKSKHPNLNIFKIIKRFFLSPGTVLIWT